MFICAHSYIRALEEDALYAEALLRDVWRRYIRNPDDRGNPQLSVVLVVHLCTHLSSDSALSSKLGVDSFSNVLPPGELPASAVSSSVPFSLAAAGVESPFTVRMAPLLIPVLCKVSTH